LEVDGEARLTDATDMGSNDASLATKKYVDDNDSDTTYTAGTGLSLDNEEFSTNDSEIDHNSLNNYQFLKQRTSIPITIQIQIPNTRQEMVWI